MKRDCLCDMHSLTSMEYPMHLFMNDILAGCLFTIVLMMFYDWLECVMSVSGTTEHS